MTVAAATAKAGPYTGNDSASSFAFSFKVFADADIRVVKTVIASGAESDLVLNTNYTVTRNADQDTNPGGSVTYKVSGVTTALPSTLKLTIVGDFDYSQPTDIPNGGSFFASIIETALDRVTMLIKQLKERVDSALTLPVSVTGVSAELPTPEAGTVLGWNTAADALVNLDAASLAGSVAAVDWIAETFDGTGAQVDFTLTRDPGVAANCDVSISGVTQVPGTDFTVSSTTLTFTTAPASGTDNICVRYGSALPSAASVPVDGVATASIQDNAVTTAKIADGAVTAGKLADAVVHDLTAVSVASGDYVMLADVSDSNKKKKALVSGILALAAKSVTRTTFTASGSLTIPAGVTQVLVTGQAPGGGGGGSTDGADGGDLTFGPNGGAVVLTLAGGKKGTAYSGGTPGTGGVGGGSGINQGAAGENGQDKTDIGGGVNPASYSNALGGKGGAGMFGNLGSGGRGSDGTGLSGAAGGGGGAGEQVFSYPITVTPSAQYDVTIGSVGSAGTTSGAGTASSAGKGGFFIIEYWS